MQKFHYWYNHWFKRVKQPDILKKSNAMKSNQKAGIGSYHCHKFTILKWACETESHFLQLRIEPGYPKWLPRRIPLLKYRFPKILLTESKMESENYFRNSFNKQPMCFYCCDKIIMNELQLLWILWMNFKIPMNGNSFMCINKRRMR